ncbi:MAG: hypothetical protein QOI99_34 [Actinomycetota bacterium]|nr:hypothetical protein [Actinomycetota bacterium]
MPQAPVRSSDDKPLLHRAAHAPQSLSPGDVLALQRKMGNRATAALLAARQPVPPTAPPKTMERMEAAFGQDFSGVRLRTGSSEPERFGAKSLTRGEEIHFAPGAFQPGSESGERLLGHELAHVAQQRAGQVPPTGTVAGRPVNDAPALERDAEESGARAARGEQVATTTPGGGARGEPVQQHFFELAWVLGAGATLGFGMTAILGLIGVFGIAAVGYALKQCLSAGEKDIDIEELKAKIVKIEEGGEDEKQGAVAKSEEKGGGDVPKMDVQGEIPKSGAENVKSDVQDVEVKDATTDVPIVDVADAPSETKKELPPIVDEEVKKVEAALTIEEPKVPESTQQVKQSGLRQRKKKFVPPRRKEKRREASWLVEEVESPPVYVEPALSKAVLSTFTRDHGATHDATDVAYWQKRGGLSDSDMLAIVALSAPSFKEIMGMDPSLFVGISTYEGGALEMLEQTKVGKLNKKLSEDAKNKPKEPDKHPTVQRLELVGIPPDDAEALFKGEGEQTIDPWLHTYSGDQQYVMRAVDVYIKTKKPLAEIDALVAVGQNPNLYPPVTLFHDVMSYGFDQVAAALQHTANENDIQYLEAWLGYGVTAASAIQLKRLVRFQARLRRLKAQLTVYQADVEYQGSKDPPSRTGFLRYGFGGGERIVIHTHWNVNAHKLVSMHVQDNSQNGMELHTWKWFNDVSTEVRDAHNRAAGSLAPTGGSLSL